MPSREEQLAIISGMLKSGVPKEKLTPVLKGLDTPEKQEKFFSTAASKLGMSYGQTEQQTAPQQAPVEEPSTLQSIGKGFVDQLPLAGALVGGTLGATTAGAASMGTGALAGGTIGASLGAGAGQTLKNLINSFISPEEAPKDLKESALSVGGAMVTGAASEFGGTVISKGIGSAVKGTAKVLEKGSKAAQKTVVGNMEKVLEKSGGKKLVDNTLDLLDDEAILSTPSTLRKVTERVEKLRSNTGEALEATYQKLDKVVDIKNTSNRLQEKVVPVMEEAYLSSKLNLSKSDKARIGRILRDHFEPNEVISFQKVARVARTLEGKIYDRATSSAERTLSEKLGNTLRQVNSDFIEEYANTITDQGGKEQLLGLLNESRKLSTAYRGIATVSREASKQLKKSSSLPQTMIGAAKDAIVTTPAKTAAAGTLKLGSNLLKLAPNLGKEGTTILKIAGNKGLKNAIEYHANLLMHNEKYRNLFNEVKASEK